MNRRWPMVLLASLGVPAYLVLAFLNAFASPVGFLTGIPFAFLYFVAGLLLFRVSPLWPRAGGLYVVCCLVWGSVVSTALVTAAGGFWIDITSKLGWDAVAASFAGALPEELVKAFGVLLIVYFFRRINRPWHGFVTGGLVGLGFEINENLLYGTMGATLDANSDFSGSVFMWGLRSIAGPGLHILLTALAGWGIGQALFCHGRLRAAAGWLLFSTTMHFTWNIITDNEVEQLIRVGILMVVLYATFILVYRRAIQWQRADDSYVLMG